MLKAHSNKSITVIQYNFKSCWLILMFSSYMMNLYWSFSNESYKLNNFIQCFITHSGFPTLMLKVTDLTDTRSCILVSSCPEGCRELLLIISIYFNTGPNVTTFFCCQDLKSIGSALWKLPCKSFVTRICARNSFKSYSIMVLHGLSLKHEKTAKCVREMKIETYSRNGRTTVCESKRVHTWNKIDKMVLFYFFMFTVIRTVFCIYTWGGAGT